MSAFCVAIAAGSIAALRLVNQQETKMITANAHGQTTDTEPATQDQIDSVATISLDEVNGGWVYSPYANPYAGPYPYASPYMAAARYEARLERRAAWMESRAARWWGY